MGKTINSLDGMFRELEMHEAGLKRIRDRLESEGRYRASHALEDALVGVEDALFRLDDERVTASSA